MKSLVSAFNSNEALVKRVETGENEALIMRHQNRKQRLKRDIKRELNSIHVIQGLAKGAIIRKHWDMYSTILSSCNIEE